VSGPAPRVDVVIVAFESRECLLAALDALGSAPSRGVVVVDNASSDGTVEVVRERHPQVRVIANAGNAGFSTACNQGWRAGQAPFVLFLNPDAEARPDAVEALANRLDARPELGIVGPLTRHADGTVQVSTGRDLTPWSEAGQRRLVRGVAAREPGSLARAAALHAREREVDWVSGACLMARRATLDAIGGFDEGFFLYEEDADLCRRARAAGWRVLFTPAVEVSHQLGRSMARAPGPARLAYHRSHLRYYAKHASQGARVLLRALLALRAGVAAGRALLKGDAPGRRDALLLLRLGLTGR
jgi:N-acetylglucosaminyl-diphospho-decaprenol L-rhamnosyltransferase